MDKTTRTTFKLLKESTFENVLKEGDLIEFRPRPFTIKYTLCSNGGIQNIVHQVDDRKTQSHWGVYIGSNEIVHVTCPKTPHCIRVLRDIPASFQRKSLRTVVYSTQEEVDSTKDELMDSYDLKPCVRKDLLFEVATVQNANPYLNNEMDAKLFAGTSEEIVNTALFLVDKYLPHDFITKDCKDFAIFCRYGETRRSLEKIEQRQMSMNNAVWCIWEVLKMIPMVAEVFCKVFSELR